MLILTGDDVTKVADMQSDMRMWAQIVGTTLGTTYPWHAWHVAFTAGLIQVNLSATRSNWGFNINTTTLATPSELVTLTKRLGGELLERFQLDRTKVGAQQLEDRFMANNGILIPQL